MRNRFVACALAFSVIFISAGCTVKVPMHPKIEYLGVSEKLPLNAALLITDQKQGYIFKGTPESFTGALRPHEFPLGMALEDASIQAFSQVFEKFQLVRNESDARKHDIIIEPSIEEFHFGYDQLSYVGFAVAAVSKIKVRVTLATGETRFWERTVESPEQRKGPWFVNFDYEKELGEAASAALVFTIKKIAKDITLDASVKKVVTNIMRNDKSTYTVVAKSTNRRESTEASNKTESMFIKERWAVVIGISKYKDSRIAGLRYASADAKSFHEWLISQRGGGYAPSRVRLLLNSEATAQRIRYALFDWLKQALEEDMVTIYFAGHGSPESPDSPNNLFLLSFDANYDEISTTGFPMWDIETALKRFIKAKKVVVIADACHSGGVGQGFDIARRASRGIEINPISSGLQNLSKIGDGVAVISASDEKQFSQESQSWGGGHGVFTYFLLKGLNGEADYNKDGRVTLGELIPYLSEQVRRETRNAQSPTVAGRFDPALSIGK